MIINRLRLIVLLLFIFFLPSQLGKHFFFDFSYLSGVRSDYLAPTLYVIDLLVIVLAALHINAIVRIFRLRKTWLLISLLVVNVIMAQSVPIALYRFARICELVVVYIAVKQTKLNQLYMLVTLAGASGIQFVLAIMQFTNKHSVQGIFYYLGERYMSLSTPDIAKASLRGAEILRPYGTFSHPNSLAGFYLAIYFFALLNKRFEKFVVLRFTLLVLSSLLVLISFSKVALLTYIMLNLVVLYRRYTVQKCIPCTVARVLVLIVLGFIFIQAHGDPDSGIKRIWLMKNALLLIAQHPIFGVGIGNYVLAQFKYPNTYPYFFQQPVHNIFLLWLSETGLLLGGYTLFGLGRVVKKHIKEFPPAPRSPAQRDEVGFLLLFLAICITGLFDHYWLTLPQNWLLIPTLFAII